MHLHHHLGRSFAVRRLAGARMLVGFIVFTAMLGGTRTATRAQQNDGVLGPQDVLTITVWGQPDMSGKFAVDADGNVTFPLIGRVKVAGLLPRDVEETLQKRLSDGYFKNPQLSVSAERLTALTINVVGEVRQAGSFPATRGMTLIEVLARAGSTTDMAGGTVLITRPRAQNISPDGTVGQDDAPEVIRVNLKSLQGGTLTTNVLLRGGDTVFVPRAESIYVLGAVKNPGTYAIQEQTTVLQALALAGGLTERGSFRAVRIVRQADRAKKQIKVKLHELLQPGDTIVVGERLF
jgi:polysaccharide export outer membrane protein